MPLPPPPRRFINAQNSNVGNNVGNNSKISPGWIVAGVVFAIIFLGVLIFLMSGSDSSSSSSSSSSSNTNVSNTNQTPPRRRTINDCGYKDKPRGWYDLTNSGVKNDFCRHVGSEPNIKWACTLANQGINDQDTSISYDPNTPFEPYNNDLTGWSCP